MNTNITNLLNSIESIKTTITDMEYKTMIEQLGEVSKNTGWRELYTIVFQYEIPSVNEEASEETDIYITSRVNRARYHFHLSEEVYKYINKHTENYDLIYGLYGIKEINKHDFIKLDKFMRTISNETYKSVGNTCVNTEESYSIIGIYRYKKE